MLTEPSLFDLMPVDSPPSPPTPLQARPKEPPSSLNAAVVEPEPPKHAASQKRRHTKPPQLLTEREAAKALAISPRKLWQLRTDGEVRCIRVGRSVRYDPDDLNAWIEQQRG